MVKAFGANGAPIREAGDAAKQERHEAASVTEDEANTRKTARGLCVPEAQHGAGCVGGELHPRGGERGFFVRERVGRAAGGFGGVDIDDGTAAMKLLEDGLELGVAEPEWAVLGGDAYAVGLEDIERVGDLGEGALDVVHGQGGEETEATGVVEAVACAPFVGFAGLLARGGRICVHDGTGVGDGRSDAVAV